MSKKIIFAVIGVLLILFIFFILIQNEEKKPLPPIPIIQASGLEIKVYDDKGNPIPKEELMPRFAGSVVVGVFPLDKDYNAIPFGVASVENGIVRLAKIQTPYILHFFPKVPGFGQVKMYADNGGGGYTALNGKIDLPLEVAKTRIANIEELIKNYPKNIFRQETLEKLSSAKEHLDIAAKSETANAREVYQALNDGLWSGEMATIDAAEYDITQRGHRNDFSFGIKISSNEFEENWEAKEDFVSSVVNMITIPEFFIAGYERKKGKPNPESAERILAWADSVGIKTKGHPLIYTIPQNTPSWLEDADFQTFSEAMQNRIERDVGHFKGRIKVWDIINEANNPTQLYSQDEIVQLTKIAGTTTKTADSDAIKVVNINLPVGDTLADQNAGQFAIAGKAQTPYQYFKALQQANADYDVAGIQMYGSWSLDLMEISRMLDRYAKFRKPIHITEIGLSSAPGIDKESEYFQDESEIYALGQWHAPWSENIQADWIEQFYTIAYSKPYVESIAWWDLTDDFWPFGGLLHRDGTPKESYYRLKSLLESWDYNKK